MDRSVPGIGGLTQGTHQEVVGSLVTLDDVIGMEETKDEVTLRCSSTVKWFVAFSLI